MANPDPTDPTESKAQTSAFTNLRSNHPYGDLKCKAPKSALEVAYANLDDPFYAHSSQIVSLDPVYTTPKTKAQNYDLYERGVYGNQLRNWTSLNQFDDALYEDGEITPEFLVGIRLAYVPGIALPNYCTPVEAWTVNGIAQDWAKNFGVNPSYIKINEAAFDSEIIIQGEIMYSSRGWELTYSNVKKMMREAFATEKKFAHGLYARHLLKWAMDTASWENVERLFEMFPDAVVEFSTYNHSVGNLNMNTVFWEVRGY